MDKKPRLEIVPPPITDLTEPSRDLAAPGLKLWASIMSEYAITDSGGLEMLTCACQSLDRAESLRATIDRDGEVIRCKNGLREHPALRHELAARAFVVRTLQKLGLDVEPVKPMGRPGR